MSSNTLVPHFPTDYSDILERVQLIDAKRYGSTRNYVDGAVTYLSPYISRGVISTKMVFEQLLKRGENLAQIEKLTQELAWRYYWQQVWIAKKDGIDSDLKQPQHPVGNTLISNAIVGATTGISAIDKAVTTLYQTGYMHNHLRMYTASVACNIAQSHWKLPAQWMYFHLLDADWASNALSWQWVAGSNSHKKYYANQENINTYCRTDQQGTFLDVGYDKLPTLEVPEVLKVFSPVQLHTELPEVPALVVNRELPSCVYNFYNLDPLWKKDLHVNRILVLEPSHFKKYPVSTKTIDFICALAKNIDGLQLYVGEFQQLVSDYGLTTVYYKEHPTANHYNGICEPRDWMFDVQGYFPSFFSFWKKCKKQLKYH